MQDHWMDLSNCINDDLTTCVFNDFPSFLTISLTLVNMPTIYICIWDERHVSKL